MKASSVNEFVDHLQKQARYTFARTEAAEALKLERATLTKGLQRLQRAGRIQMIRRGFYVIVPLEYATGGIVPPDWIIDHPTAFMVEPYCAGALTAGRYLPWNI